MEHLLTDIVQFKREGQQPYWRWYCLCGVIGGKRHSHDASYDDHQRHAVEG